MEPIQQYKGTTCDLPPLILHPFSDAATPEKLVQSSRASLMIQGLLPVQEQSIESLQQVLLDGRYCEIRMLFYVGKDTARWIEQCLGMVERNSKLRPLGLSFQSFASLLVDDPPPSVLTKLKTWGVADHRSIFTRGIGLNSVFAEVPDRSILSDDFIRNYHQFADQMFSCRMGSTPFGRIRSAEFAFELYASGEYTTMLEKQWQPGEAL
jgi:hypothetical protein